MNATGFSIEDNTKQLNSLAETSSLVVSLFILVLIVLLYGIISFKLYKKNQFDMEPMHVFQLNFMIVSSLRVSFPALSVLDKLTGFNNGPAASCLYYFPIFFAYFSFNTDLVLMQVDRFLDPEYSKCEDKYSYILLKA